MFEIFRATSIANEGFLALMTQVFLESGRSVPDKGALDLFENAIRQDRVRFYMALEESRVVGVVSLTFSFSTIRMGPWALISDLYVHPGHRGRGCAAALVLAAMDGAHEEGCGYVATNLAAEGLEGVFRRFGWTSEAPLMTAEIDLHGPPPSLVRTGKFYFS